MNSPAVSILLPCHRGHDLLGRAIESCLTQSLENFELLLVLHRADAEARAIAKLAAGKDSRVRLLECEGTFVDALNAGHEAARGGLVARMDSDDRAHPGRLQKQAEFLASRPEIAVAGSLVRILKPDGGGPDEGFAEYERWLNSLVEPDEIAAQRFVESPIANPSAMFRRDAVLDAGGHRDSPWAEDYDLYLRMLAAGMRIAKVPEVLLDWSDLPERLTRTDPRYSQENFLRAKAHYLAALPDVRDLGVSICGAGPIGKQIARFLTGKGVAIHAFYEVHPRRIGEQVQGVPVRDQAELRHGEGILLSAVGQRGKRDVVRQLVAHAGYDEGRDFFCVA